MTSRRWLFLIAPLVIFGVLVPAESRGRARYTTARYYATGKYDVIRDKKKVDGAEVLFSQRAASYIIVLPDDKEAVVLRQRSRRVGRVEVAKLKRRSDGYVELPRTATVSTVGRFVLGAGARVAVIGPTLALELRPRPPLLKHHTGEQLLKHSPQYGVQKRTYRPNAGAVAKLKSAKNVEVEVLFGSWCSRCSRLLGHMLKLEDELGKSGITFKYYGLPNPPAAWREPHYKKSGIHGLPTAVVRVNGRVRGRLAHGAWTRIESALLPLVR